MALSPDEFKRKLDVMIEEGLAAVERALDPAVHASFTVRQKDGITIVTDQGNGVSITADIEAVVASLYKTQRLRPRQEVIIIRDVHGRWDVVELDKNGTLIFVRDLDLGSEAEALAIAKGA